MVHNASWSKKRCKNYYLPIMLYMYCFEIDILLYYYIWIYYYIFDILLYFKILF